MRNERVQEGIPEMAALLSKYKFAMIRLSKWFDYLFILRPTLFFPVWTVYAAGLILADRSGARMANAGEWQLVIIVALTLLMGSAYILNQLVDVESDRLNNKLFLLADGHIPMPAAVAETIVLFLLPLVVAALHSLAMLALFVVIYIVTGILYSAPRFRWKDKPWLGIWANAIGAYLIFAAGWWTIAGVSFQSILNATPYAAAVSAVFIYTTIVDIKGDVQCDKITFAVKYGKKWAIRIGAFLEIVSLISAWLLKDPIMMLPALVASPFYIHAAVTQKQEAVVRAIKFPILMLASAVCFFIPVFLLLLAATFFVSKWYYHFRFGLKYPNFDAK